MSLTTSRARKPNHFESRNSLEVIFVNIRGLSSFFADSNSFLESNSFDILAIYFYICETIFEDSVDLSNIFGRVYIHLIPNDFVTHA